MSIFSFGRKEAPEFDRTPVRPNLINLEKEKPFFYGDKDSGGLLLELTKIAAGSPKIARLKVLGPKYVKQIYDFNENPRANGSALLKTSKEIICLIKSLPKTSESFEIGKIFNRIFATFAASSGADMILRNIHPDEIKAIKVQAKEATAGKEETAKKLAEPQQSSRTPRSKSTLEKSDSDLALV